MNENQNVVPQNIPVDVLKLYVALRRALDHLEYTGYGDSFERECAKDDKLSQLIQSALDDAVKNYPMLVNVEHNDKMYDFKKEKR